MRLIDADKMIADLKAMERVYDAIALDGMIRGIERQPTVDAVEVTRCKDCRYWRHEVDSATHWVCTQHSYDDRLLHTTPDFYCADWASGFEADADPLP